MYLRSGLFSFLISSLCVAGAAVDQVATLNAFQISKEKNGNLVKYDVHLKPDCTFADSDPLSIYWMIQDKSGGYQRKDMNFIENGYYGLSITKKTANEIDGQVKSLKNRDIDIKLSIQASGGKGKGAPCMVQTLGTGEKFQGTVRLTSIKLEDFHGEIPHELAVIGKKSETREPVQYQISLK